MSNEQSRDGLDAAVEGASECANCGRGYGCHSGHTIAEGTYGMLPTIPTHCSCCHDCRVYEPNPAAIIAYGTQQYEAGRRAALEEAAREDCQAVQAFGEELITYFEKLPWGPYTNPGVRVKEMLDDLPQTGGQRR